jgi:biopolymer transport protein ExbB/TolQ
MKKYGALLILFLLVGQLSAQRRGPQMTSEERAQQQTTLMTDSLSLSEAQVEKVAVVNLEYANKMSDARTEMRNTDEPDFEAMRAKMQELRQKQNEALNKYLTSEQAAKWKAIQEANRQNRSTRRGKGNRKQKGQSNK